MNRPVKYYPEVLYVFYGSDFPLEMNNVFRYLSWFWYKPWQFFFHPVKRDFLIASPTIIVSNALICLYMV